MVKQQSDHHSLQPAHDQLEPEERHATENSTSALPLTSSHLRWQLSHLAPPQRHRAVLQLQREQGNAFVQRMISSQRGMIRRDEAEDTAHSEDGQTAQSLSTDTTGVVKWFNSEKGYGFIQAEGQEKDVYFHFSAIVGVGYPTMNEGDRVALTVVQGKTGLQGVNVRKI